MDRKIRQTSMIRAIHLLDARLDVVTISEILERARHAIQERRFFHIITANPLMLLDLRTDPDLRQAFQEADLVIPEAAGIALAVFLRGAPHYPRIAGIDLMTELCRMAAQESLGVYLLGARPGIAELAAKNLQFLFPSLKIAGTAHGYFEPGQEREALQRIQDSKATIVFVGLQSPEQEKWISRHRAHLAGKLAMGVGGSFDVLSGRLSRAPKFLRQIGFEWLYRWIQEPWRWKRMARLPVFLIRALLWRDPPKGRLDDSP